MTILRSLFHKLAMWLRGGKSIGYNLQKGQDLHYRDILKVFLFTSLHYPILKANSKVATINIWDQK